MIDGLVVEASNESRQFWAEQGLASQNLDLVMKADVLLVPFRQESRGNVFVFHQDSSDLYEYLKTALAASVSVEICADDDEYFEIALHSKSIRLAGIVCTMLVAPVVVNVLSSYITDQLKAKPGDELEMSLILEGSDCKNFQISFKGDAKDFGSVADKVGQIARDCEKGPRQTAHHKKHDGH